MNPVTNGTNDLSVLYAMVLSKLVPIFRGVVLRSNLRYPMTAILQIWMKLRINIIMDTTFKKFIRQYWLLLLIVLLKMILQFIVVNPYYELHRDEFLHLDQANHLAFGFISVPPFTSLVSKVIFLLGGSLLNILTKVYNRSGRKCTTVEWKN